MNQVRSLKLIALATTVIAVGAGAIAISANRMLKRVAPFISLDNKDLEALQVKYGPEKNSEHAEEWIIRDFFKDERGGVFVDVGANDYKRFSNTYYLESQLGWSGIAIEPQTKFAAGYAKYRSNTRFVPLFVSNASDREAHLFVPKENDLLASGSADFANGVGGAAETLVTKSITLDDLLARTGVTKVDFLTMDIELGEPAALAGFSIRRFRPRLVCVEAHDEVRQLVLTYFARNGYVLVGKYWRADAYNFWFTPAPPSE